MPVECFKRPAAPRPAGTATTTGVRAGQSSRSDVLLGNQHSLPQAAERTTVAEAGPAARLLYVVGWPGLDIDGPQTLREASGSWCTSRSSDWSVPEGPRCGRAGLRRVAGCSTSCVLSSPLTVFSSSSSVARCMLYGAARALPSRGRHSSLDAF